MKLVQLFFTGVLVMGMQMHAQEQSSSIPDAPEADGKYAPFAILAAQEATQKQTVVTMEESSELGAPAASQQSYSHTLSPLLTQTETESAGDKESTASESSEEAGVELASSSESSEEAALSPKSPQQKFGHLSVPPRFSEIKEKVRRDFDQIKNERIPQFRNRSFTYKARECFADRAKVETFRKDLKRCEKGEGRDHLIAEATELITELTDIQTKRGTEVTDRVLRENEESEAGISALDDSQDKDKEGVQAATSGPSKNHVTPRSKQIFAWIFGGTVAAAAVATIVYYLWYNKLPVLQHK